MNKKLRERVLSVLKEVEYSGWDYVDRWDVDLGIQTCCPICGSFEKHEKDCELAALIKELEDEQLEK